MVFFVKIHFCTFFCIVSQEREREKKKDWKDNLRMGNQPQKGAVNSPLTGSSSQLTNSSSPRSIREILGSECRVVGSSVLMELWDRYLFLSFFFFSLSSFFLLPSFLPSFLLP